MGGTYKGERAQILVIPSIHTPEPEELEWVNSLDQTKILEVDYPKYFVVIVFNGYRGGIFSQINILRIWKNTDMIFVVAHFNDFVPQATSLPAYNSQYQVVKISKQQIAHPGVLTFQLLDESGKERARVMAEVSK